jgi:hypothetical protein
MISDRSSRASVRTKPSDAVSFEPLETAGLSKKEPKNSIGFEDQLTIAHVLRRFLTMEKIAPYEIDRPNKLLPIRAIARRPILGLPLHINGRARGPKFVWVHPPKSVAPELIADVAHI